MNLTTRKIQNREWRNHLRKKIKRRILSSLSRRHKRNKNTGHTEAIKSPMIEISRAVCWFYTPTSTKADAPISDREACTPLNWLPLTPSLCLVSNRWHWHTSQKTRRKMFERVTYSSLYREFHKRQPSRAASFVYRGTWRESTGDANLSVNVESFSWSGPARDRCRYWGS